MGRPISALQDLAAAGEVLGLAMIGRGFDVAVAVPFGECDLLVLRLLRTLGIRRVYTSFRGPGREGAWLVRRDCITADMPDAALSELLTKRYTAFDAVLAFLREWKHAGQATFWSAN